MFRRTLPFEYCCPRNNQDIPNKVENCKALSHEQYFTKNGFPDIFRCAFKTIEPKKNQTEWKEVKYVFKRPKSA